MGRDGHQTCGLEAHCVQSVEVGSYWGGLQVADRGLASCGEAQPRLSGALFASVGTVERVHLVRALQALDPAKGKTAESSEGPWELSSLLLTLEGFVKTQVLQRPFPVLAADC